MFFLASDGIFHSRYNGLLSIDFVFRSVFSDIMHSSEECFMFDTFMYIHKWLLGWWNMGGMLSSLPYTLGMVC